MGVINKMEDLTRRHCRRRGAQGRKKSNRGRHPYELTRSFAARQPRETRAVESHEAGDARFFCEKKSEHTVSTEDMRVDQRREDRRT